MGIKISEIRIPSDCGKLEWCPLLSRQGQGSEAEGDDYEWLEEFLEVLSLLNQKGRRLLREGAHKLICDWTEKLCGAKAVHKIEEGKPLRFLDKVFAVDSEVGGAPLWNRTLVVFMKLGRRIPYETVLKEEIDTEIAERGLHIQVHKRGCQCMGCKTRRTAVEVARKRVYRALKLRDEFGFATRFVSVEQWQAGEKFRQMLRLAASREVRYDPGGSDN